MPKITIEFCVGCPIRVQMYNEELDFGIGYCCRAMRPISIHDFIDPGAAFPEWCPLCMPQTTDSENQSRGFVNISGD